jgi:hypothetical protein
MIRVTVVLRDWQLFDRFRPEPFAASLRRGAFMGAQFVQGVWIRLAQAMDIRATGAYIRGIDTAGLTVVRDDVTGTSVDVAIFAGNDAPHAAIVEYGHRAFRLPEAINWGSKAGRIKMGKRGPYLHIPFRHRAYASPGAADKQGLTRATRKAMMPEDVYREAKALRRTIPLKTGPQRDAQGWHKHTDTYKPGGRLDRGQTQPDANRSRFLDPLSHVVGPHHADFTEHRGERFVGFDRKGNALVNPSWQSSKFQGLMKTGPKGHTAYMTVRTITPTSAGWNIPAQPGKYVAHAAAMAAAADNRLVSIVIGEAMATLKGP